MAVNKKYTAINRQSLLMAIDSPYYSGSIEFKVGYGLRKDGYLLTADENLQKALEEDKRFNQSYRLAQIDNVNVEEYYARLALKEKSEKTKVEKEEEPKTEVQEVAAITKEEEPVTVESSDSKHPEPFKNAQEAKNWLNREHGVPFNQINSKPKLMAKATELGFKITLKSDNQ